MTPKDRRLISKSPALRKAWLFFLLYYIGFTRWITVEAYIDIEPPLKFTSALYNASVKENAFGRTPIVSEEMMGMFVPEDGAMIRYRIVEGDRGGFFRASHRVVGNFCFLDVYVRTGNNRKLNRESKDQYKLRVKAHIRNADGSRGEIPGALTIVKVRITDENDLPPFFIEDEYVVDVSEDTPLYSSVIQIEAEDPDDGLNGQVYFSFKEQSLEFHVHPTSGIISLTRPLKFLAKSTYELTVVVQDRGHKNVGISYPSEASVVINVKEVNVFEPQIEVVQLNEPSRNGHLIYLAIVNVIDNDDGPSGEIKSLEIVDGDNDRIFRILPGSGSHEFNLASLQTIRWKDAPYGYNLTLKAIDKGARPKVGNRIIPLRPPAKHSEMLIFSKEIYEVSIPESYPPGSKVAQIGDLIPGTQSRITFTISAGNEGGEFKIDPRTGVLNTAMFLDAEMRDTYSLTVDASSTFLHRDDDQQMSARVVIKVLDANDNTPMIVAPQGVVEIEV